MNLFIILIIFYFLLYFFITKPNTKNNFFIIFFFSKYFLIIKYNLNKIQKYQIFEPFFSFLPFSQIKLCVFNYPFFSHYYYYYYYFKLAKGEGCYVEDLL